MMQGAHAPCTCEPQRLQPWRHASSVCYAAGMQRRVHLALARLPGFCDMMMLTSAHPIKPRSTRRASLLHRQQNSVDHMMMVRMLMHREGRCIQGTELQAPCTASSILPVGAASRCNTRACAVRQVVCSKSNAHPGR